MKYHGGPLDGIDGIEPPELFRALNQSPKTVYIGDDEYHYVCSHMTTDPWTDHYTYVEPQ